MCRAFGYCRVSSEKQAVEGDSIAVQRGMIEAICALEGYSLSGMFVEPGVSGSVPFAEREQGAALLAQVRKGDVVIALKLDRAFRDTIDALTTLKALKARGVGLYLKDMGGDVTGSNVSALVFSMLSSVATFERSRISERIADAKRHQRAQGRFLGGPHVPFGFVKYEHAGKAYIAPVEHIHAEARRLKAEGYSLRRAAGYFQGLGHQVSHCAVASLYRSV